MPQSFLIFDFGRNEEAAQQARHRLEAWKQALRLGDRVKYKFERQAAETTAEPAAEAGGAPGNAGKPEKKKKTTKGTKAAKPKGRKKEEVEEAPAAAKEAAGDQLRLLVRLEFSDHEKLSYQRWLDRIPGEAPFPEAKKQLIRRGQDGFEETSDLFDELA